MLDFEGKVAVKICGLTNATEAVDCAAAGADMLGLNFSPRSPRCVDSGKAMAIVRAVRAEFPETKFVGVFLDQEANLIESLAGDLGLDAVQLHGEETPEYVRDLALLLVSKPVVAGGGDPGRVARDLAGPGSAPPATTFVIKALRVVETLPEMTGYRCAAILLDRWSADAPGGTGEAFPWALAAALRPEVNRLFLAGGLTSANVAAAIEKVRPFAVDVCSGVESAPGRKEAGRVRAFLAAVQQWNHEKIALRA